jgi:hypothetical protein
MAKPKKDNQLNTNCKHHNKHLKVIAVACGCETVVTVCDDCNTVLDKQVEC